MRFANKQAATEKMSAVVVQINQGNIGCYVVTRIRKGS